MQKIKVLMVGPDRTVHGGISAVVNEMYAAGLDKRVDLKYIGTMKEGSKLKKLFVAAFAYARFLRELAWCDVVHVHFSSDASYYRKSYFMRAAHRHGKKLVLHQHGGDFKTFYNVELGDSKKKRLRDTLSMGDVMLVLTRSWKEFFSGIVSGDKIMVFPNGVMTGAGSGFSNKNKDFNKILFLGRICKDKGIEELLAAMKLVHEDYPEVKLYIGGIYEDEYFREKVDSCGDYVKYLGWVSGQEKDSYLEECGILVLPSYYEGFPVSIIEAMLRRSAVVASNVGGIPDIIQDGADGILIPPKDSEAIKNSLEKLISDTNFAMDLGEKGREKVLKNYSIEKNIDKLVGIYSKL